MRYLKFKNDETGQRNFALLQLVFQRSGYRPRSSGEGATVADVVRAVNKIGVEYESDLSAKDDADEPENVKIMETPLRLTDEGGMVKLETAEHRMLLSLIDTTPFTPNFQPKVQDMRRWVKDARTDVKRSADDVDGHSDGEATE